MSEPEETRQTLGNGDAPLTPQELLAKLDQMGFVTETVSHEALFTVEQSSKVHKELDGGHTKNLFLKDKKSNYFLVVAEAHADIDLKRLHTLIGGKGRLSFGDANRLMEFLGVRPGSVTAFAPANDHDNKVQVVIDKQLLDQHDQINCHPLSNEMTTSISTKDLLAFLDSVNHPADIIQVSGISADSEQEKAG